jgi:small-conductance mechanosensitive channel
VEQLLLEVADENDDVVTEPPPTVRLVEFGENALRFELRAWSRSRLHRPGTLRSNLNLAIVRKFREHDVVIPVSKDFSQSRNGSPLTQAPEPNTHQEKRGTSA